MVKPKTAQRAEQLAMEAAAAGGLPGQFDVAEDLRQMQQAGMTPPSAPGPGVLPPPGPVGAPATELIVETEQPEETEEEMALSEDPNVRVKQIHAILAQVTSNIPSVSDLITWKNTHSNIFFLQLEDRIFVYRYLKRQEHLQLNADPNWGQLDPAARNEKVFRRCVLWPQFGPMDLHGEPAGLVDTLVGQIELQSMFIDPYQLASTSTLKL